MHRRVSLRIEDDLRDPEPIPEVDKKKATVIAPVLHPSHQMHALADLRARGVQVEEYSPPAPVTTDGIADMGHSWSAWFIDPSRNVLAVVEPKR